MLPASCAHNEDSAVRVQSWGAGRIMWARVAHMQCKVLSFLATSTGERTGWVVLSDAQLFGSGTQVTQHMGDAKRECNASLAMCMLLLLKRHLKAAYSLTNERITSFNPGLPLATFLSC